MTNLDQFESVFKAAEKTRFQAQPVTIESALVVSDLTGPAADEFDRRTRQFLAALEIPAERWRRLTGDQFAGVGELLQRIGEAEPDLVCLYRNLHIPAREYPYSLGVHVDVLTQASTLPVLVMPHPEHLAELPQLSGTRTVMAIADHLTGEHKLVSHAARFTQPGGTLWLTHVEDETTFERYMGIIERLPSIDSEDAREAIHERLLKEPSDYIDSCDAALQQGGRIRVEKLVTVGHRLADYKKLIDEHQVDLLVLNTKDEDQLAMHGLAYPLTVELRHTPLLLL